MTNITEEMIKAGAEALRICDRDYDPLEEIVADVFRAMTAAQHDQSPRSWPLGLEEALARDRALLRAESSLRYRLRRGIRHFEIMVGRMAAALESK